MEERMRYMGSRKVIDTYNDYGDCTGTRYADESESRSGNSAGAELFGAIFTAPFSLLGHALAFLLFGRARTVSASRLLLLFFVVMFLVPVGGLLAYGFYLHPHKMAVALPAFWHFIVAHYL